MDQMIRSVKGRTRSLLHLQYQNSEIQTNYVLKVSYSMNMKNTSSFLETAVVPFANDLARNLEKEEGSGMVPGNKTATRPG